MSITPERKQVLIGEYGLKTGDTGSPEVQVAILSERIRNLTDHLGPRRRRRQAGEWCRQDRPRRDARSARQRGPAARAW